MDKAYADAVRLLLAAAPEVFANDIFAMKGGTASLETLLETRARLRAELPHRLTGAQRFFLKGLSRAQPDWTLLQCPRAADLPALRWKLANLQTFSKRRPRDFEHQARALETRLG